MGIEMSSLSPNYKGGGVTNCPPLGTTLTPRLPVISVRNNGMVAREPLGPAR
jgi:hypothetical protein